MLKLLVGLLFFVMMSCSEDDAALNNEASNLAGTYMATTFEDNDTNPSNKLLEITEGDTEGTYSIADNCAGNELYTAVYDDVGNGFNLTVVTTETYVEAADKMGYLQLNPIDAPGTNVYSLGSATDTNDPLYLEKGAFSCDDTGLLLTTDEDSAIITAACGNYGQGNGRGNLLCAGVYRLDVALVETSEVTETTEEEVASSNPEIPDSTGNALQLNCVSETTSEIANADFTGTLNIMTNDQLYLGNIIKGNDYANNGSWSPLAVSSGRDGFTFSISGLALANGVSSTLSIDELTGAGDVADAVNDLITTPGNVLDVSAAISYEVTQVYSASELELKLGLTVNVDSGGGALSFSWGEEEATNYYSIRYIQTFYEISMNTPLTPWAFFNTDEDGQFADEANAIVAGNPPLYVGRVGMGRALYLNASSTYTETEITAGFTAEYTGSGVSIGLSGEYSQESVVQNTTMTMSVMGGSAAAAAELARQLGQEVGIPANPPNTPLNAGAFMTAVGDWITEGSTFSQEDIAMDDDGLVDNTVPITYDLRYVADNSIASTALLADYNSQNCTVLPEEFTDFRLVVTNVDDHVYYWVDNASDVGFINESIDPATGSDYQLTNYFDAATGSEFGSSGFDKTYDFWTDGEDHTLRVQLRNDGCYDTSYNVSLQRKSAGGDWSEVSTETESGWGACNWWNRVVFRVNRSTGSYEKISGGRSIVL
jgi:hypothetical protein